MDADLQPLLFLDFDGVLNRVVSGGYSPLHPGLAPDCVALVGALVQRYNLRVVVSSSWREPYNLARLRELLRASGGSVIADALLDVTPVYEKVPKKKNLRPDEVVAWLGANAAPGTPYVVLDDAAYNFPVGRFVRTQGARGFHQDDFNRAAFLLEVQVQMSKDQRPGKRRIHLWLGQPAYWCPVCKQPHRINTDRKAGGAAWSWNGDYDYPTIGPHTPGDKFSILYTGQRGGYSSWRLVKPGKQGEDSYPDEAAAKQAATDAGLGPEWKPMYVAVPRVNFTYCHTYIKNGTIQVLADSMELGGQTLDLSEWERPSWVEP